MSKRGPKYYFVSVLLVSDLASVLCARPPRISSGSHEVRGRATGTVTGRDLSDLSLVADSGDRIQLRCDPAFAAASGVSWDFGEDTDRPRLTVEDARLTIENVKYTDTGLFTCSDSKSGEISSLYIYVRDSQHLFLDPRKFYRANVITSSTTRSGTFIGCKPTDPDAEFRLKNGNNLDITSSLEDNHMAWSPQSGLWILKGKLHLHSGLFKCYLTKAGVTSEQNVYITLKGVHEITITSPRITKVVPKYPVTGDQLAVHCSVYVSLRDVRETPFTVTITGPATQNTNTVTNRTKMEIFNKNQNNGMVSVTGVLTVTNLEEDDSGQYKCQVTNTAGAESPVVSEDIKVVSETEVFIGKFKFGAGNHVIRQPPGVTETRWMFSVEARPRHLATFVWRDPRGNEIDTSSPKYEMTLEDFDVKLVIRDVTISDMGAYPFEVSVVGEHGNKTRTESLVLVVNRDPEVDIIIEKNLAKPFFEPNKGYTASCDVTGYPIDKSSLEFYTMTCDGYPNQKRCNLFEPVELQQKSGLVAVDGGIDSKYNYNFSSTAMFSLASNIILGCKICSSGPGRGCGQREIPLLVSEHENGFEVTGLEADRKYYTGDEVTIQCLASKYKYSKITWSIKNKDCKRKLDENRRLQGSTKGTFEPQNDQFDRAPLIKICGVESEAEDTEHSFVQTLTLSNLTLEDTGQYTCRASTPDGGRPDTKRRHLEVYPIVAPRIMNTNMNGTTVSLRMEEEYVLFCHVGGDPRPSVAWYKDGVPVNESNFIDVTDIYLKIKYLRDEDSGHYECVGENPGGSVSVSLSLDIRGSKSLVWAVVGGVLAVILLIGVILVLTWRICYYKDQIRSLTKAELDLFRNGDPDKINDQLDVHEQTDLLPYNRDFEFPADRLNLGILLGSGAFGRVLKAEASGIVSWEPVTTVAVKMVKPQADISYIKALMAELKIMMHLGRHLNIVNLLGACTVGLARRELLVIVEYCRFGNIQKYLIHHRNKFVNQMDPKTGIINFEIGKDLLKMTSEGQDMDFATERETVENSAHFMRSVSENNTGNSSGDGYLVMSSPTARTQFNFHKRNGHSVRYTKEPFLTRDLEASAPLTSDMTVDTEVTSLTSDTEPSNRTYSVSSRLSAQGPGWRSNMRGDYGSGDIVPVSSKDLLCWAYQVARGMEYLASKKVMHGDLACRNILLAQDNVVKICDFGLAKDIYKTNNYHKKSDGPLPVKWLAVECLRDRIFSTQSDVWAFGIVLWEMFSLGRTPYPGIEPGQELYEKLLTNYRMARPEFCPHDVYKVMLDCWSAEPKHRPRFRELADSLGDLLGEGERDHYMRLDSGLSTSGPGIDSELLRRMASPDYRTLTSQEEEHELVTGADGYLAPDIIVTTGHVDTDTSGYLVPTINRDTESREPGGSGDCDLNSNGTLPSNVKLPQYTKC